MTKITINRATVEQAYEALWYYHATEFGIDTPAGKAIAAFHAALAQQAEPVEPVAWMYTGIKQDGTEHGPHLVWKPEYMDAMSASKGAKATPLYTAPPKRKPLTDEKISDLWCEVSGTDFVTADAHVFARAVERAHGIGRQSNPQIEDRLARHGIPMPGDPK